MNSGCEWSVSFIISIIIISSILVISTTGDDRESEALSKWWPFSSSSHHCNWTGITCNRAGRVAEMRSPQGCSASRLQGYWKQYLDELDVRAFPYLTTIHLTPCDHYSLVGEIPMEIGKLSYLTYLNLSGNRLYGELPPSLLNLTKLEVLDISSNDNISGAIPPEIGSLSKLTHLSLGGNLLTGELPPSLLNITKLEVFDISSSDNISGAILPEIGNLSQLTHLHLSRNQLKGELPPSLSKLAKLQVLDISKNIISGRIPYQLGLGTNAPSLSIDLSFNKLSGGVPKSLSNLMRIDLSYNILEGEIPPSVRHKFPETSFFGNPNLLPRKSRRTETFIDVVSFLVVCSMFGGLFILIYYIKRTKKSTVTPDPKHGDIFKIWNYDGKIAYKDIIEATADFDIKYRIGTGGCGSVYRARLPSGRVVAVKKLHRFEGENPTYDTCCWVSVPPAATRLGLIYGLRLLFRHWCRQQDQSLFSPSITLTKTRDSLTKNILELQRKRKPTSIFNYQGINSRQ